MQDFSLHFAKDVTSKTNHSWESGEMLDAVTPTTKKLLRYWFSEEFTSLRPSLNFHEGQRQAILNTIYLHEVLGVKTLKETYEKISPDLLLESGMMSELAKDKYDVPKYAIKMATGTGKTWVLQALLIWQYLNAVHEDHATGYSKNFLVIAPGLIVYERLIDALRGRRFENGEGRDFETTDLFTCRELFIPEEYRDTVFGFLRNAVKTKEELTKGASGNGLIAITNWHALAMDDEDTDTSTSQGLDIDPQVLVSDILPARPGTSAGNSLDVLDGGLGRGAELEYLRSLPDLVVFNDEAHRVREETKWHQSLAYIASAHKTYVQVDFSATPYEMVRNQKQYFPHIIVDFDLKAAILQGLVKTLVLDKRVELAAQELDYKAERDENNNVVDISDGQRLMLRAGLKKLRILEEHFVNLASGHNKYPKMMVVCEDTNVVPKVTEFLRSEGLGEQDVLEIHSNKQGEVKPDEWETIKGRLFSLDKHASPKVVVSVLMLREGFDVSNICVIVPLRSTQSGILLEQTIGRGLRLMWREPEFQDLKDENRKRLLFEKKEPSNYFDILSIIEHPRFVEFYKDLLENGLAGIDASDFEEKDKTQVSGDIVTSSLRSSYRDYDFAYPIIVKDTEKIITKKHYDASKLPSFAVFTIEQLKRLIPQQERFISQEAIKATRFGDYDVHGGVMTADSYNDYLARLVNRIMTLVGSADIAARRNASDVRYPLLQIQAPAVAQLADQYIRTKLFNTVIDPFEDNNWRLLLIKDVAEFVVHKLAGYILQLQETSEEGQVEVLHRLISEVAELKVRESASVETTKTVYERTPFPSHSGGMEKAFIEYADSDTSVDAFVKLVEHQHTYIRFRYLRDDGMISHYYPDFLVRCGSTIYIVETKSTTDLNHPNVKRKQKAVLSWKDRINALPESARDGFLWEYVLLGETTFYDWKNKGGRMGDLLEYAKVRNAEVARTLFE